MMYCEFNYASPNVYVILDGIIGWLEVMYWEGCERKWSAQ